LLIQTENIEIEDRTVSIIANSKNELAQLLLMKSNLLSETLLEHVISEASSWILLYELFASDYMAESDFVERLGINTNLSMYRFFKQKNLHFVVL
jgi:hypothetical protein